MAPDSWGTWGSGGTITFNNGGKSYTYPTSSSSITYDTASDWVDCTASASGSTSGWKVISYNKPRYRISVETPELIETNPKITAGAKTVELPDGAKLIVDDVGNYRIEDKDAKVTYKANRTREFSPHLNASDMMAQFVKYVGSLGVRRSEVMGLPIYLFIAWLVIEAAERDGDEIPSDVIPVPNDPIVKLALKPKCLACGRFIRRLHYQHRFPFCSPEHGAVYLARKPIEVPRLPAPATVAL